MRMGQSFHGAGLQCKGNESPHPVPRCRALVHPSGPPGAGCRSCVTSPGIPRLHLLPQRLGGELGPGRHRRHAPGRGGPRARAGPPGAGRPLSHLRGVGRESRQRAEGHRGGDPRLLCPVATSSCCAAWTPIHCDASTRCASRRRREAWKTGWMCWRCSGGTAPSRGAACLTQRAPHVVGAAEPALESQQLHPQRLEARGNRLPPRLAPRRALRRLGRERGTGRFLPMTSVPGSDAGPRLLQRQLELCRSRVESRGFGLELRDAGRHIA